MDETGLWRPALCAPSNGTPESIAAITADDLRAMHKLLFSRKSLKVAVVGDIDAATLAVALG